jgi:peptidyl-prolyl cis-trans isomerase C
MAKATARHILVDTEVKCEDVKKQIEDGGDFAELAKEHSRCPSGRRGGDLGEFSQGQMVKEFDDVVFSGDLGVIHGPIRTQFGFHLIEITNRD